MSRMLRMIKMEKRRGERSANEGVEESLIPS